MTEGLQSAELNARRRFAAFISYAHADAAIASKLQARLERYRLPKHLAQSHTGGEAALGQIFRDREDLAAAPSLSDAIRAAISEAEALVVICSPDAVASRWVGEEIALFRSLHPDRPILAAVVRGTPEEALPAALTEGGNEPLAADLRKEADGPSLGFLKIVAGIAGVPLDALVQRDAQRRIRRVMWITGSALAAMLIMGIMTTLALQARNEAARQRAEAEGLVEYMLTDLRDKLKGVGRLDVMTAVNKRAMDHYGQQGDLTNLPSDSLDRRARILHAMGEDDEKRGDLKLARKKFEEAHRVTKELLNRSPDNPDRIFTHGQSEYWVGYGAWRLTDIKATEVHWRGYLSQAQALARVEPGSIRSLMELGYAHGNMCELLMNGTTDIDGALENCKAAIGFERNAVSRDPQNTTNVMALANRLGWMADALVKADRHKEALVQRREEQTIIDGLLKADPKNSELQDRQTWPQIGIGKIQASIGQTDAAITTLSEALRRAEAMAEQAPENIRFLEAQVRINVLLAAICRKDKRQDWHGYRDKAAALITSNSPRFGIASLVRASGVLAKLDNNEI